MSTTHHEPATRLTAGDLQPFHDELRRFLRVCGCDAETALDLCQETFLLAVTRAVEFPNATAARSWLLQSAKFLLLAEGRSRRRRLQPVDPSLADAAERHFNRLSGEAEWLEAMRGCLASMRGRPAAALALIYREQVSHESAAITLGLHKDGLKTLLRRARAALRVCMERKLPWMQSTRK